MNNAIRLLLPLLLLQITLLCVGMGKVYGQSVDFKPPQISLYEGSGLSLAALKVASAAALDSLSKQYGIPLESTKRNSRQYSFVFTAQIVPNLTGLKSLKLYSKFPYKNIISLSDITSRREVIRVENYPKDLLETSQNPDSLKKYYIALYEHSFKLMAGYGLKKIPHPAPKSVAHISFEEAVPSAELSWVKDVVKDLLFKNQEIMGYKVAFGIPEASSLTVCKIKVRITGFKEDSSMNVSLLFPIGADLDYHGNPIQTEFPVSASDLKSKDFSYLLAKMTATLYKFSETNFKQKIN